MSDDPTATQPPPWHPQQPPPARPHGGRQLRRSTTDRYLGGVAGGIAQTYDVDPIIVRVVFLVLVLVGGSGVLIYLALWLIVPKDDGSLPVVREPRRDRGLLIGMILLAIGVIALMNHLARHGPFVFDFFWPVVLIGGGLAVLLARANDDPTASATTGATAATTAANEPAPSSSATAATNAPVEPTQTYAPTDTITQPSLPPPPATQSAWAPPARWPSPPAPPAPPPRPPRPPRGPRVLGPLTVSVLLLFIGGAALLNASGAMSVNVAAVASISLLIVGAALLIGAYYGRAHGLIALGILLTLVAGTLASTDVSVNGPTGKRTYVPLTESSVRSTYRVGIGDLQVDLRNVTWSPGVHTVHVRVGIGEARVFVGPNVTVTATGHTGVGAVRLFERSTGGTSVDDHATSGRVGPRTPIVHIDARVGIGDVHVVQTQAQALTTEPLP